MAGGEQVIGVAGLQAGGRVARTLDGDCAALQNAATRAETAIADVTGASASTS